MRGLPLNRFTLNIKKELGHFRNDFGWSLNGVVKSIVRLEKSLLLKLRKNRRDNQDLFRVIALPHAFFIPLTKEEALWSLKRLVVARAQLYEATQIRQCLFGTKSYFGVHNRFVSLLRLVLSRTDPIYYSWKVIVNIRAFA